MAARLSKAVMADDGVWAAICARRWGQRTGLPVGNLWEPGTARKLEARAAEVGRQQAWEEAEFRFFGDEAQPYAG